MKKERRFGFWDIFNTSIMILLIAAVFAVGFAIEMDIVIGADTLDPTNETNETNESAETIKTNETTNNPETNNEPTAEWIDKYGPEDGSSFIYEPNKKFVLWSVWNISNGGEPNGPIGPDGEAINEDIEWTYSYNTITDDNLYNFSCTTPEIPSGNYTWSLSFLLDVLDETYSTPTFKFEVKRAEPNIEFSISENIIYEGDSIEINAKNNNPEGKIYLLINGSIINDSYVSSESISVNHTFSEKGEYLIEIVYNGSENYEEKRIEKEIGVLPLVFSLELNKENYTIGEEGYFKITAPNGSNANIEFCGPEYMAGQTWITCSNIYTLNKETYPLIKSLGSLNTTGEYSINATISHQNKTYEIEKSFIVSNNLQIEIEGKLDVLVGEELELEASASGGIPGYHYSWILENGTRIEDKNLEIKYDEKGNYGITLEVKDSEGNSKTKQIAVDVDDWREITIRVKDSNGKAIESAYVDFGDRSGYTKDNGEIKLKVPLGEHTLRVEKKDYEAYRRAIEVKEKQTIDVVLQLDNSLREKLNQIVLFQPKDESSFDYQDITFLASVSSAEDAECTIFLKPSKSDWFEEIKSFDVEENYVAELTKTLDKGKYEWKIECDSGNDTFSSEIASFEVEKDNTASVQQSDTEKSSKEEQTDGSIDAGSLRTKIEEGFENLNGLDLQSKSAAEALSVKQDLERTLQTFERKIRDLNNLQYRKDLSNDEKKKKAEEYQAELKELEKNTISTLKVEKTESYVSYPKQQELVSIANQYIKEKGILGKVDEEKLKELQNKLSVETKASHVTLQFLDNHTEEITLVEKVITYSGADHTRVFILENISKGFAETTNAITFVSSQETIKKDPLVKFELKDKIIYYTDEFKDFESIKESQTIVFSENLISTDKGGNLITGAFSLPDVDFTSPIFGIILVSVVIAIYLIFSTEVGENMLSVAKRRKKKQLAQIRSLINDALDYLQEGNLERANMVFKEIKLIYEKMPQRIKEDAYEEALSIHDKINKAYLLKMIDKTAEEIRDDKQIDKIERMRELNEAYDLLNDADKKELKEEVEDLLKILNNQSIE